MSEGNRTNEMNGQNVEREQASTPSMQKPPGRQGAGFAGTGTEENKKPPKKSRKKLLLY